MKKYDRNIHDRIYRFVLDVLLFCKKIPKSYENQILVGQLIRAITSVGANDQEADGAFSRNDFTHCYTVVRKEAKESVYWIRLFGDLNNGLKNQSEKLVSEGTEIVKIITSIILNTKNKI